MPTIRRVFQWVKRVALGILALAILVALSGTAYQTIAGNVDRGRYPAPGRLVDVDQGEWHRLQRDLLNRSMDSRHVVADGSGHYVQDDRPDIVITAIRDIIHSSGPRSN